MQVGTTKDQGLYNKLSAAVHPGALATGTLFHTYIRQVEKCSLNRIQTDSEQETLSLGIKRPDSEANHLSLLSRL